MTEGMLLDYIANFTKFRTRSMFGGIGLFKDGAMFAVLTGNKLYIRGGGKLDLIFEKMGCGKLIHVKKQSIVTVNYYNVTNCINKEGVDIEKIIARSINQSVDHRASRKSSEPMRLRELPNMRLTLERMVKKSGIPDVDTFMSLGATEVFSKVRNTYGNNIDINLLWKFSGAIDGVHWKLIEESKKQELLDKFSNTGELEPV